MPMSLIVCKGGGGGGGRDAVEAGRSAEEDTINCGGEYHNNENVKRILKSSRARILTMMMLGNTVFSRALPKKGGGVPCPNFLAHFLALFPPCTVLYILTSMKNWTKFFTFAYGQGRGG